MTNRVSCFCLPFPVGVQRNVVYYITSFSVCQGVLEAFFDFLFREPIPFPNRLGSALPKDQLTSSRCSAQRHLLYHIQLLLSRGFWKISVFSQAAASIRGIAMTVAEITSCRNAS